MTPGRWVGLGLVVVLVTVGWLIAFRVIPVIP